MPRRFTAGDIRVWDAQAVQKDDIGKPSHYYYARTGVGFPGHFKIKVPKGTEAPNVEGRRMD